MFSLLLQSQHSNGNFHDSSNLRKNNSNQGGSEVGLSDTLNLDNENKSNISLDNNLLSSSVPRLLAGYEDGSISCFDIRTLRYSSRIP